MRNAPEWVKNLVLGVAAWVVSIPVVRKTLRSLRDRGLVPDRVARSLALRGEIPISLPWAPPFLMCSGPRNALVRALYFSPRQGDEPETLAVFVDLIGNARVFVDVGANQGLFTLVATAINPEVRVHAFEPNPSVNGLLRANIAANRLMDRVTVSPQVVSDQAGVVEFRVPESPYSAAGAMSAVSLSPGGAVVGLPAVRLDDVLGDEQLDVLKIDDEGAEARVIRGARKTLRRTRPVVILEVLEPHDNAGAERLLRDLGYEFYHLTADGPVRSHALVPDLKREYRNYLCLPAGRRLPGAERGVAT